MASRIENLGTRLPGATTAEPFRGPGVLSSLARSLYALLSKLSTLLFKPTPDPKVTLQTVSLMRQCYVSLMQASLACYHAFQALFQAI